MKRLLLAAVFTSLAAFPAPAAPGKVRIVEPWRAGQYQGAVVAVRGRADIRQNTSLQGTEVRLIGADGRLQFIGFVPKLNEYLFPNVLSLSGREVVMYGVIEMYRSVPATQLLYRGQLQPWPVPPRS